MNQFTVQREENGQTLGAVIRRAMNVSWSAAKAIIEQKSVKIVGVVCADPARRLKAGQLITIGAVAQKKAKTPNRPVLKAIRKNATVIPKGIIVRHTDDQILVVEKPAGLTTMRHREEAAEFGHRGRKLFPRRLPTFCRW